MNVAAAPPDIELDHVSKEFGRQGSADAFRAVDDISLAVVPGELVALLGKTGCGKSTIFNMIAGVGSPGTELEFAL